MEKPIVNITVINLKSKCFSPNIKNTARIPTFTISVENSSGVFNQYKKARKEVNMKVQKFSLTDETM